MPLLEVRDLATGYGATPVLRGASFDVAEGSTAVMLGLNGAGKTTTLATIAGLHRPWSGRVEFDGRDVTGVDAAGMVQRGVVLVPEGRHVFPGLSVAANLRLGAWPRRRDRAAYRETLGRVYELFPRLEERAEQVAVTLSGGEQQMLALARGMMAAPRLLLVDEATLGLSPRVAQLVFEAVDRINDEGVTVLLVGQSAAALRRADHALVMQKGRVVYEGAPAELLEGTRLRDEYLGISA